MSLSECSVPRFVTISKSPFLLEGNGIVLPRTNSEPIRPTLMATRRVTSVWSFLCCPCARLFAVRRGLGSYGLTTVTEVLIIVCVVLSVVM